MKSMYTLAVATCLLYGFTLAAQQPTLTEASNLIVGEEITIYDADVAAPNQGPSGADITWDFGTLEAVSEQQATFVNPIGTPFSSDFPNASVAIHYENGLIGGSFTTSYEYYNAVGNNVIRLGLVNNAGTTLNYSNPQITLAYPFTYLSTNTDDYGVIFTVNDNEVQESGTVNITGDAYGTLILPYGTIEDVVRIYSTTEYVQSIEGLGDFPYSVETYSWYHPELAYPLLTITSESFDGGTPITNVRYTYYKDELTVPSGVGINDNGIDIKMNTYPNPATSMAYINYHISQNANVQINVYNTIGQHIQTLANQPQSVGNYTVALDVNNYAAGIYIAEILADGKRQVQKIIVQ